MLKYGLKALTALPRFFSYRNEIDIYTEDKTSDKEFYKTILSRLVENKITINDITPLGCKENVIEAYRNQINEKSQRRRVYIVDGDLELITNQNIKATKRLIVLDSYCIENYIIDEQAAIELLYLSLGVKDKDAVKSKLKFIEWLNYNNESLIDLFLSLAISKKYFAGLGLKSARDFLTQQRNQHVLDKVKLNEYIIFVKKETIKKMSSSGIQDAEKIFDKEYIKLKKQWPITNKTMLRVVSGKDYLLPLLQFRINHCVKKSQRLFQNESLKLFCAKHCSLERLDFLKKVLIDP